MLVCITGKIGSGKTYVLNEIKKLGYATFNVDKYVHSIYKKGKIGYKIIKDHFGLTYVNECEVDRKKLGQLVFSDVNSLDRLNSLMLPIIHAKLEEFKYQKSIVFAELAIYLDHQVFFKSLFSMICVIIGNAKKSKEKIIKKQWFLSDENQEKLLNSDDNKNNAFYFKNDYSKITAKKIAKNIINFVKKIKK